MEKIKRLYLKRKKKILLVFFDEVHQGPKQTPHRRPPQGILGEIHENEANN